MLSIFQDNSSHSQLDGESNMLGGSRRKIIQMFCTGHVIDHIVCQLRKTIEINKVREFIDILDEP